MFDPFKDYRTHGYLRNRNQDTDPLIIQTMEHLSFQLNLPNTLDYLSSQEHLCYPDFLETHRLLFSDYYPWAGQDRAQTSPHTTVQKDGVIFAHPQSARLGVEKGLEIAQISAETLQDKAGTVMGLFAYAHPFLEGNGRTMLVMHLELCHLAGFSIAWEKISKTDYLNALTQDIQTPDQQILDRFLLPFHQPAMDRTQ